MIRDFVHRGGRAELVDRLDPSWLSPGIFGMNVPLPSLVGSPEHQFREIIGIMLVSSAGLFIWFRTSGWL